MHKAGDHRSRSELARTEWSICRQVCVSIGGVVDSSSGLTRRRGIGGVACDNYAAPGPELVCDSFDVGAWCWVWIMMEPPSVRDSREEI
jgi:hypothetical protein